MTKSCAFFGNDYQWSRSTVVAQLKEVIVRLIEERGVDTFYVGQKWAYENDAYNAVLQIQKDKPDIKIILVVSNMREVNEGCRKYDDFVLPDKSAVGCKRWCIVHRNNWIVENTDFIVAYNQYQGRAFEVCKRAKNKGVTVIELANMPTGALF